MEKLNRKPYNLRTRLCWQETVKTAGSNQPFDPFGITTSKSPKWRVTHWQFMKNHEAPRDGKE